MTKANREGRPLRSIESIHALGAWSAICRNFRPLVDLEAKVQTGNLTPSELRTLFDDACSEMLSAPFLQMHPSEPGKSREERLRSAAENFQAISHHLAIMLQLKTSVETAWTQAEALLQHWKNEMLALAVTPPVHDAHALGTAARVLKAAGLTCPISRSITESQLERIGAILKEQAINNAPPPSISHPPCPVIVDWKPDNAWVSMRKDIPGYELKERLVTPQEQGLAAVIELGLPPFTDLSRFDLATEFAAFQAAGTNHARRRECWKLLKQWMNVNKVAGWNGPITMKMREQAWVFMFAVQYGFTQDVAEFRHVRFPSPWTRNAVIVAERACHDPE